MLAQTTLKANPTTTKAEDLSFSGPYGIERFRLSEESYRVKDPKWAEDAQLKQFTAVDVKIALPNIGWKLDDDCVCIVIASLPRSPSVLNKMATIARGKLEQVG